jgi:uncharacterized protein (DUF4415 family)
MARKKSAGAKSWVDPDDAPELTEEWFRQADFYVGERLVRRGRPPLESPKRQITLRLDADVIEGIRATGPGWSGRVNDALRRWVDRQRKAG